MLRVCGSCCRDLCSAKVTAFKLVHNERYLGIYFDAKWRSVCIKGHATLINGALHEPDESSLRHLEELVWRVFRNDIKLAGQDFTLIVDREGQDASVRHLASLAASWLLGLDVSRSPGPLRLVAHGP